MQRIKKHWLGLALLLLVAVAAAMIYTKLHPKELPANLVEGTGRIDGDLVNLNTKYPGRLEQITVDDGTPVTKGMLIAQLKSDEYEAKLQAAKDQIVAKRKELDARRTELEIARTTTPQLLEKARALLQAKEAQLQELKRQIASQESLVDQDRRDLARMENLFGRKLIQKELLEKSRLKYDVDLHTLEALHQKSRQLEEAVRIAQSDLVDAQASQKKVIALEQGIEALEAGIRALESQTKEIEAVIEDLTLRSPLDGTTVEKVADVGEVIGAGMPVATLISPDSLYLKIFVDTLQNGRIKLHDRAQIFLDAWPDRPIPAEVVRIAQKAEFTPKEVSVRSDRIQRVFAVHLKPLKPDPLLKLGIPAIGVISLDGKGLPKSLREIPEI